MTEQLKAKPGSVIHGTLRPQDLVPAFLDYLREHGVEMNGLGLPLPDDDHDWWQSEECSWLLHETLFYAMDDLAPVGHYFGAHPGDGSDFGYWPDAEEE
jgi:hypothetical protein